MRARESCWRCASQSHKVTKQLLAAHRNVDLHANREGVTAMELAEHHGHAGIATLIRNKKQETPLLGSRVVINLADSSHSPSLTGAQARCELRRCLG